MISFQNLGDFVLTNGSGVENTKMINYMFKIQPMSLGLYQFVRKFMEIGGLSMKGYLLTILVIFYLQSKHLMPSVQAVQSGLLMKTIGGKNQSLKQ
jgi:hypothetical protein